MGDTDSRTLRQRQSLLVTCLAALFDFADYKGYELTLGEGYVRSPRKLRNASGKIVRDKNGHVRLFPDGEHMVKSLHNIRLAQDLNLFVKGKYVTSGSHPAWEVLGVFWEDLDPLCRWGGRFRDANHVSITYRGRA